MYETSPDMEEGAAYYYCELVKIKKIFKNSLRLCDELNAFLMNVLLEGARKVSFI